MAGHTDGATDGDHLQVTALEATLQRRVGRVGRGVLEVEDIAIRSRGALDDVGVGIALEAVDDAPAQAWTGGCRLPVLGRGMVGASAGGRHRLEFFLFHADLFHVFFFPRRVMLVTPDQAAEGTIDRERVERKRCAWSPACPGIRAAGEGRKPGRGGLMKTPGGRNRVWGDPQLYMPLGSRRGRPCACAKSSARLAVVARALVGDRPAIRVGPWMRCRGGVGDATSGLPWARTACLHARHLQTRCTRHPQPEPAQRRVVWPPAR